MKKLAFLALLSMAILACKDKKKTTAENKSAQVAQAEVHQELYGFWLGRFLFEGEDENGEYDGDMGTTTRKINIVIKKITKDTVVAQSIFEGVNRPLLGKLSETNGKITITLDQPGNLKTDGRFQITLDADTLKGSWTAFKKQADEVSKTFKLVKKQFVYDASVMLPEEGDYVDWSESRQVNSLDTLDDGQVDTIPNSFFRSASNQISKLNASNAVLKEADLKNLKKLDLQIIKNTIFARHGYAFKKNTYRNFFEPVEWYIPVASNVDNDLTSLENKNIKLIDRFIQYAEDNYDTFGR